LSFQQDCPVSAKPRPVFYALGNIAGIFEPGFCTTILLPLRRTLRLLKLNCAKHYSTPIWQRTYYDKKYFIFIESISHNKNLNEKEEKQTHFRNDPVQ
jgi:hypothetical protein